MANLHNTDEFTYSLEKIRLEIQTAISLMPEFLNEINPRAAKAKATGKEGVWITLDELECANTSCTQIMATLLKDFDILLDSSRMEKIQTAILEANLCQFLEKEMKDSLTRKSA